MTDVTWSPFTPSGEGRGRRVVGLGGEGGGELLEEEGKEESVEERTGRKFEWGGGHLNGEGGLNEGGLFVGWLLNVPATG